MTHRWPPPVGVRREYVCSTQNIDIWRSTLSRELFFVVYGSNPTDYEVIGKPTATIAALARDKRYPWIEEFLAAVALTD